MWGETIWAISARAELAWAWLDSVLTLLQYHQLNGQWQPKKACEIPGIPWKMSELFCLHVKSWDIPILGLGCPWLEVWIFSCALQMWTAAECCFHMEN